MPYLTKQKSLVQALRFVSQYGWAIMPAFPDQHVPSSLHNPDMKGRLMSDPNGM
jgi:hypothetical protein